MAKKKMNNLPKLGIISEIDYNDPIMEGNLKLQ